MKITSSDFEYVRDFAKSNAAIILGEGKEYLVETRLAPVAQECGCASLEEFVSKLKIESSLSEIRTKAIDALTTNETFFFRDFKPYEMLRKDIIPKVIEHRQADKKIRIWSAACSTGQEPYSIAMLLQERFPQLADWSVSIIATDLSDTVLNRARSGCYNQFEVNRGLPAPYLFKYFTQNENHWQIKDDIRQRIDFRKMNLVQAWPVLPSFDIVLIRNVLIYFDIETKKSILENIGKNIQPHGSLILGAAETTVNLDQRWATVRHEGSVAYQWKN